VKSSDRDQLLRVPAAIANIVVPPMAMNSHLRTVCSFSCQLAMSATTSLRCANDFRISTSTSASRPYYHFADHRRRTQAIDGGIRREGVIM
jgi:hypothetical protein